jgi:tetratricopeptide (TPR) repeat protein
MTGSVPASLRWMTNMMGISGNKEEGFAYLEQAARSDSYVSNDARMILTYLYKQEERYRQALVHIKELCTRYRENVIFRYNFAQILEKIGREEEARQAYNAVIEMENPYLPELAKKSRQRLKVL